MEEIIALVVDSLVVCYGRRTAVDHVSWKLEPGYHALLGPNGAGKTSLLDSIATVRSPTAGSVTLDGLRGVAIRDRLGYCPQENLGRSRLTVREHFAYVCWLRRISDRESRVEIGRILELTRLAGRADDRISSLSGGMRRRVGIGSALVGSPSLIVLDEPSAGLDVAQRDELRSILDRVSRDAVTVVATHIVEDVVDISDTITVMDRGKFLTSPQGEDFSEYRDLDSVRRRYLELVER